MRPNYQMALVKKRSHAVCLRMKCKTDTNCCFYWTAFGRVFLLQLVRSQEDTNQTPSWCNTETCSQKCNTQTGHDPHSQSTLRAGQYWHEAWIHQSHVEEDMKYAYGLRPVVAGMVRRSKNGEHQQPWQESLRQWMSTWCVHTVRLLCIVYPLHLPLTYPKCLQYSCANSVLTDAWSCSGALVSASEWQGSFWRHTGIRGKIHHVSNLSQS